MLRLKLCRGSGLDVGRYMLIEKLLGLVVIYRSHIDTNIERVTWVTKSYRTYVVGMSGLASASLN